ncbi:MAG: STT3 domain-containing protein, partial [Candidatus Baldrarchaeia archaeon]
MLSKSILRKISIFAVLMLIYVISVYIRLTPALKGGAVLPGDDPLFHYRLTKYVVDYGKIPEKDRLGWHPWGYYPEKTVPVLHYYIAAYIYKLITLFNPDITVYKFVVYMPAFASSIAIFIIYLIGKEIWDVPAGLFSAFTLGTSLPYIERTTAGFYRHEQLAIPGIVLTVYFTVKALKSDNLDKAVIWSMLSGFSLIYVTGVWNAFRFLMDGYAVLLLIGILINKVTSKLEVSMLIPSIYCIGSAFWYPQLRFAKFWLRFESYVVYAALVTVLVYEVLKRRLKELKFASRLALMLVAGVIIALSQLGIGLGLGGRLARVVFPAVKLEHGSVVYTVTEHAAGSLIIHFNYILPLSILGMVIILSAGFNYVTYLILYLTILGFYFSWSMARLPPLAAPFASLTAGISLSHMYNYFMEKLNVVKKIREIRRKKRKKAVIKYDILYTPAIYFMAGILLLSFGAALGYKKAPETIDRTPSSTGWREALEWLKENTSSNDIILSWWDYGYWIANSSNRITLADGLTINSSQIRRIAKGFMGSEEEMYN